MILKNKRDELVKRKYYLQNYLQVNLESMKSTMPKSLDTVASTVVRDRFVLALTLYIALDKEDC